VDVRDSRTALNFSYLALSCTLISVIIIVYLLYTVLFGSYHFLHLLYQPAHSITLLISILPVDRHSTRAYYSI